MLQPVPTLSKTPEGYRHLDVAPICGALGAELTGVDLSKDLSDDVMAEIHRALNDYCVIFFRDQDLTPDQQKDFGRRFGTLNIHPIYEPLEGHPEILQVVKEADAMNNIGDSWHSADCPDDCFFVRSCSVTNSSYQLVGLRQLAQLLGSILEQV